MGLKAMVLYNQMKHKNHDSTEEDSNYKRQNKTQNIPDYELRKKKMKPSSKNFIEPAEGSSSPHFGKSQSQAILPGTSKGRNKNTSIMSNNYV